MDALRWIIQLSVFAGLFVPATRCLASEPPAPERYEFRETHMGTEFSISVYSKDEARAICACRAAFDRVAELDAILSDYKVDSELMRLCAQAGGPPVAVSDDLYRVLEAAQSMARRSEGAFDITVKPVVKLWRRARRRAERPDPEQLAGALRLVGHEKLVLHPDQTVTLTEPGMELDLGGIAKGYAADAALAVLRENGLDAALVAAAGDIVVGDPPPGQVGWRVAIASLDDPELPSEHVLMLENAAISTSGDASQFVEIDGVRYAHIVDPATGLGVVQRASVTIATTLGAAMADSMATAVFILGPARGLNLVEAISGVESLIVWRPDDGLMRVNASAGWEGLPRSRPQTDAKPLSSP